LSCILRYDGSSVLYVDIGLGGADGLAELKFFQDSCENSLDGRDLLASNRTKQNYNEPVS